MLNVAQLKEIFPKLPIADCYGYLHALNQAMERWEINTPNRQAMFLACLAAHSKQLRRWRDSGTGEKDEFNEELGNIFPGDGRKFKAGGPIPIKGRAMYVRAQRALGFRSSLVNFPSMITRPDVGLQVAAWLWTNYHKCNLHADLGTLDALWWCHWKLLGLRQWGNRKKLKRWKAVRDAWNRALEALIDAPLRQKEEEQGSTPMFGV